MTAIQIKIIVALVLIAFASTVVLAYNHAITKAATAEKALEASNTALKSAQDTIEAQAADKQKIDALLAEKAESENTLRRDLADAQRKFKVLQTKDPEVNAWAIRPVPNGVIKLLQPGTVQKPNSVCTPTSSPDCTLRNHT